MLHPQERLSAAEDRFDLWRRRIGLPLGPLLAAAVYLLTPAWPEAQRRLAAVLTLVLVYWITEAIPIPITALLGPALCVAVGAGDARDIFRHFGSPVIFVFLGGFLLARAMAVNGLDRRVAIGLLRAPGIGHSPTRIRMAIGFATAALSMWISNTATAAMMFPIVIGVGESLERAHAGRGPEGLRACRSYTTGLLLMTAYAASIGGLGTPVGTPPNLIGLGMLENLGGRRIPFFEWMLLGLPIALGMLVILELILRRLHPAPPGRIEGLDHIVGQLEADIPAWGRAQTFTLVAFFTAVILWITPGAVALFQGTGSPLYKTLAAHLDEGSVALFASSLLFILPVRMSPPQGALGWHEATRIDWGTILLFGGGLSLGALTYSSGLAERLAQAFLHADSGAGLWTITTVSVLLTLLITETTSNVAAASMIVPVAIAVSKAAGVSPLPPAIGATLAASLAFMLPVSTPPNAIMYGSGRITIVQMFRAGFILDFFSALLLLGALFLLLPALGLL